MASWRIFGRLMTYSNGYSNGYSNDDHAGHGAGHGAGPLSMPIHASIGTAPGRGADLMRRMACPACSNA